MIKEQNVTKYLQPKVLPLSYQRDE